MSDFPERVDMAEKIVQLAPNDSKTSEGGAEGEGESETFVTPRSTATDGSPTKGEEEVVKGEVASPVKDHLVRGEALEKSDDDEEEATEEEEEDDGAGELYTPTRPIFPDLLRPKEEDDIELWSTTSTCSNDTIQQQRMFNESSSVVDTVENGALMADLAATEEEDVTPVEPAVEDPEHPVEPAVEEPAFEPEEIPEPSPVEIDPEETVSDPEGATEPDLLPPATEDVTSESVSETDPTDRSSSSPFEIVVSPEETVSDPEGATESEGATEPEVATETVPVTATEPEVAAETVAEVAAESVPVTATETVPVAAAESVPVTAAEPKSVEIDPEETVSDPEGATEPEPEVVAEVVPETETVAAQPAVDPWVVPGSASPEPVSEPEIIPEPVSEPEIVPEPAAEPEPVPEPTSKAEVAPEPVCEVLPEPVAETKPEVVPEPATEVSSDPPDDVIVKEPAAKEATLAPEPAAKEAAPNDEAAVKEAAPSDEAKDAAPEKEETKSDGWVQILGNDSLKRRVKKEGTGAELAQGQQVTVKYSLMLATGKVVDDDVELTFQLGDGEAIDALDLSANLAKVGEVFEVTSQSRFAYGTLGRPPTIGPNCAVLMVVEVLQSEETPQVSEMTETERIRIGDRKRRIGNDHFARYDYERASKNYRGACNYLDPPSYKLSDSTVSDVLKDLQTKTWCNLAFSELKQEKCDPGIVAANRALEIDPSSTKALYRKGKLYELKGEMEEAEKALKLAVKVDPESQGCKAYLAELTKKIANQKKKQQRMYKKMFNLEEDEKKKKAAGKGSDKGRETSWMEGAIPMVAGAVAIGAFAVAAYNGIKGMSS